MLRFIVSTFEAVGLLLTLVLLLNFSVTLVFLVSVVIFLGSAFVLISGRTAPRIRSRGKGFVISCVTGLCLSASASILHEQREEHLAYLKKSDPDAYLNELARTDEERWLLELETLRPEIYATVLKQRAQNAKAERLEACSDRKRAEAFVMIQNDVRRQLRAPATAEFPGRYDVGTLHEGDCIYRIVGHVDSQNGFGALIRANFRGRIEYFPKKGSWRTVTLEIESP